MKPPQSNVLPPKRKDDDKRADYAKRPTQQEITSGTGKAQRSQGNLLHTGNLFIKKAGLKQAV